MEDKFKIEDVFRRNVSDQELILDLKTVVDNNRNQKPTFRMYGKHGKYATSTILARFESWNKALTLAGVKATEFRNYPDEELFKNLLSVWEFLGRQPRVRDLSNPPSNITLSPYMRRFKSWISCLEAFVVWANGKDEIEINENSTTALVIKTTRRNPSDRQRFRVLKRDSFKCLACGSSPAVTAGVELHLDHILPWSKGGATTDENLQTLCQKCNLGKSDVL